MSTRATLIYDTEKGLHIYQELLDNTVHVEVAKEAVLIDVEIMPFEQWVSLGLLKENIRVLRAAEQSVQADEAQCGPEFHTILANQSNYCHCCGAALRR